MTVKIYLHYYYYSVVFIFLIFSQIMKYFEYVQNSESAMGPSQQHSVLY